MHIDVTDTHTSGAWHSHPILGLILVVCSGLFAWFQSLTIDEVWQWSWRILALLSAIPAIYINWNKALDIYKNKKQKQRDGNNIGNPPKSA